ncbi:MAG: hypothetical protein AAGF29_05915 [Pseudomonadota bacterium]
MATPLASLAQALSLSSNSQSIGIAAGSAINEGNLDFRALDGIRLEGYGDFASHGLPLIRAETIVTSWQTSAERGDNHTSVYSFDGTIEAAPDSGSNRLVPFMGEDGTVPTWVESVEAVQATPGSYHVQDGAGSNGELPPGTYTFYVHPLDGSDPRTNGKTYSYTHASGPAFGDDATLRYLEFGRQLHRNGIRAGFNFLASNIVLNQTHPVHSLLAASGLMEDVVCIQDFVDTRESAIALEFYTPSGSGQTGTFRRCHFRGVSGSPQSMAAIGGHTADVSDLYDRITIEDCSIFAGDLGGGSWADDVVVERCKIEEGEILIGSHATSTVRDNWCLGASGGQAHFVRYLNQGTNLFEGNRTYGNFTVGAVREAGDGTTMRRNVIVRRDNTSNHYVVSPGGTLVSFGNIFDDSGFWWNRTYNVSALAAGTGHNVFANSPRAQINGTVIALLPDLQTTTAQEANSVQTDPQLADPANGNFTAQASGLPANSGLERFPTYAATPADLASVRSHVINS